MLTIQSFEMIDSSLQTAFQKGKVCALLGEGMSDRQVSRKVGVPRSTVGFWRSNAFRLSRRVGCGRKRKTSSRSDRLIVRLVRNDPTLSSGEVRTLLPEPTISSRSVQRRLREANFLSRKRPSSVELTKNHKRARLDWAMRHCHWRSQWGKIVWTDEASVCLRARDGRLRVWVQSGDELPEHLALPVNQGGGRLLIWAAIWKNGRSELHVQKNNMNSEGYVHVLERNILPLSVNLGDPSTDWILMDDNATCHRSSLTNAFKSQTGIRTLRWPARSPDLNPIENVWSLLKRAVRRSLRPGDDISRLEVLLRQEWERLNQAIINRLIESMSSRVRQVIQCSGKMTKY